MTDASLAAVRAQVVDRLAQHRANLAGWSEGRACTQCRGLGRVHDRQGSTIYDMVKHGNLGQINLVECPACNNTKVLDVGPLAPTESESDERAAVRRELKAAIVELEMVRVLIAD